MRPTGRTSVRPFVFSADLSDTLAPASRLSRFYSFRKSSGSFATLTAIRRASSLVSIFAVDLSS
jgi:hypothetical protein